MGDTRRSPLAAALLNLTGLGLGYAYVRRWWRLGLHLLVTTGLVVIAFVTGGGGLPWLWAGVAALWLGWMAVDGWRIAAGWFARPASAAGHVLPVGLALLAVAAVVAGYAGYAAAGRATVADAIAARDAGDCEPAVRGFELATGVYELAFLPTAEQAESGRAECAQYLEAVRAEQSGDLGEAVRLHRTFAEERPGSVLVRYAESELLRVGLSWATELREAGDPTQAIEVLQELRPVAGDDAVAADRIAEELAATYLARAEESRQEAATLSGGPQADAVRAALADLLAVQEGDLAGTDAAAGAPALARGVYDTAATTWAGAPCDALPTLDHVSGLDDARTGGAAAAAVAERPRQLFACGVQRYESGAHGAAAEAFDAFVAGYPADPQVAQARANAIAARAAEVAGGALALPGPYAGDDVGPVQVTFYNDSPEEVRVYVVGATAHEVVLPPCTTCPPRYATAEEACPSFDGRPSAAVQLGAGTFTVVGRFASADPDVGTDTFESGFVYTSCFYVVGS